MQKYIDKINFNKKISAKEKIILELGCGKKKKRGCIGVDVLDLPDVDIVTDLENGLRFIPNNSVDEIYSKSFFEHINNFEFLMKEIYRILKPNGKIDIFVPHFSNPYYYSDYTHKRFFGFYTFYYFSNNQKKIKRKVPAFYNSCNFEIVYQKLFFTSYFRFIKLFKIIFGRIINSNILFQEFYEAHLTSIFSCYGIEVELRVKK